MAFPVRSHTISPVANATQSSGTIGEFSWSRAVRSVSIEATGTRLMHVALPTVSTVWGGSEIHTVRLARTLSERGHSTTLVGLTERAYQVYRDRVEGGVSLACLAMPKPSEKMGF